MRTRRAWRHGFRSNDVGALFRPALRTFRSLRGNMLAGVASQGLDRRACAGAPFRSCGFAWTNGERNSAHFLKEFGASCSKRQKEKAETAI